MSGQDEFEYASARAPFGRTLDVGAAHNSASRLKILCGSYTGVDMQEHSNVDIVHDMEQPLDVLPFDDVICLSTLEHCRKVWLVAENIERLIKPGGRLILSVPWAWRVHNYPSDYWRISPEGIKFLFPNIEFGPITNSRKLPWDRHPTKRTMLFATGTKRPVC